MKVNDRDAVKLHFERLAGTYGENFAARRSGRTYLFRKRLQVIDRLLRESSGVLLDCACGTGDITAAALRSGAFRCATVVDVSHEMLRLCAERLRSVPRVEVAYVEGDVFEYVPPEGVQFDAILCLGLVAHTGRLSELLQHVKRMLAPSGRVFLQTSLADHVGVRLVRLLTRRRFHRRHGYEMSYFTIGDVRAACSDSGLMIKEVHRYYFGALFLDRVCAPANYWLERVMSRLAAAGGAEGIFVLGLN